MALLMAAGVAAADASSDFLTKAMQASLGQVELGKLAQKNAQSSGVNALGVRLEHDHARIGKILTMVARQKGVTLPVALDGSRKSIVDALSAKTGAAFDAAYTAQMLSDHQKAIALFTTAANSSDPELNRIAKLALPTLREDERLAESFAKLNPGYDVQAVATR
jgi:putative membrane protein